MSEHVIDYSHKTVLVSAGGTGGHVYPALAVANELRKSGATLHWLGTAAGIESRLVPAEDIPLHTVFVQGIRGNGLARLLKAPWTLLSAVMQARGILKRTRPDVFVGFGGFVSGPGALAAKLLGIPVIIHEQNAAMGLTNRFVSYWAKRVLLAFPITGKKGHIVGNPIRLEIMRNISHRQEQDDSQRQDDSQKQEKEENTNDRVFRVLVVGGSLGAKAINEIVPQALSPLLGTISLTHQTGKATYQQTRSVYEALGVLDDIHLHEYIDDMSSAYARADLVIARAGALTVSEIASIGLPAIFIPLPHAVDNHQFLNAHFLEEAGAACIIEQKVLTVATLRQTIESMLDKATLKTMASAAQQHSHENALAAIIEHITEVTHAKP